MRVAILGGTGFIGTHLTHALVDAGYAVTVAARGRTRPPVPLPGPVAQVILDRDDPGHAARLLTAPFDAVIDLSGHTPDHIRPFLLDTHRSRIGHYVFCSTSSVYRVPPPCPHREDAPLTRRTRTYGGGKARAEGLLAAQGGGWPVTILRPQGVFGAHDARQAAFVFSRLEHSLPLYLSTDLDTRINLLFVADFIDVFLRTLRTPSAHLRTYNVAGDDVVTARQFIALCAATCGRTADPRTAGPWSSRVVRCSLPWLSHNLVADTTAVTRDLHAAFTPLPVALDQVWRWLRAQPGALVPQLLPAERCYHAGRPLPAALVARGLARAAWRAHSG